MCDSMGRNLVQRLGYGNMVGLLMVAMSVVFSMVLVTPAASGVGSNVLNAICTIFNTIKEVIFVLGLALMILGGAIYAGANLMPSQSRGSFQGYGMAMIIGGIIGVAIAVAAPYILNLVITVSGSAGTYVTTGVSGAVNGHVNAAQVCAGANA
jgi:hypothetical protein